jgi:Uma2 family endonuclease
MSLQIANRTYAPDEYLALERQSEVRHELFNGHVYAMAGESPEHSLICTNISGELRFQFKGGPCAVYSPNMKVLMGENKSFAYPDVTVVCGEARYYDDKRDVIVNPIVLFEVLSPSTEAFDRGDKFLSFRKFNSTLMDYVLVSQYRPFVDHYTRQPDDSWILHSSEGLESHIQIPSIHCQLSLAEIYDRIVFKSRPEPVEPL